MFFIQPETKWKSRPWASFNCIVDDLIVHRQNNPAMTAKFKKSVNRVEVENEVDAFIAQVCEQMNWLDYVIGNEGAPPPTLKAPNPQELSQLSAVAAKAKQVWAGLRTLGDWLDSGEPAVAQELSNSRGSVCVECPKNGKGDFTTWFAAPAAAAIKRQVEKLEQRKLATTSDEKLGACEACLCPMRLKVHVPIEFIKSHTTDATLDKLRQGKDCWVVKELAAA
jgi:hypothetical protein